MNSIGTTAPTLFGEPALQELFDTYFNTYHEVWDPAKVYVGPVEWMQNVTNGVARLIAENESGEEGTVFKVGAKVRRCDGITGLATQNGVVRANYALVTEVATFEDLGVHHDENLTRLAQLVMVNWYAPNGALICSAWHSPEQLAVIE